jgi:acetyl esterase/lipase/hemerythrin-like domain-containing protein
MPSSGRDLKASPSYLYVESLFVEHDYTLRVLSLIEAEVDRFYKRLVINFSLLEQAFKYLCLKAENRPASQTNLIFENLRRDRPDLAGLVDELLIGAREIFEVEVELLAELRNIDIDSRFEKDEIVEKIKEFCVQCREHIAMEERGVLLFADQYSMNGVENYKADPLFGVHRSQEFDKLNQAYLDSAKRVSTGHIPYAMLELGPVISERIAYTGMEVVKLPQRFFRVTRFQFRKQLSEIRLFKEARSITDFTKAVKQLGGSLVEMPSAYITELHEALQAIESADYEDEFAAVLQEKIAEVADVIDFRRRRPRRIAGISWQAAALNLFLRGTLKQLMGFVGTDYAEQAKGFSERWDKPPRGCDVSKVDGLSFKAEWLKNKDVATSNRVVLYLPGGGFFFPAIWAHKEILAQIMHYCGAEGLLAHYRLAPDNPFPAGLDDALEAYRFLLEQGYDPEKIVIVGDSAGGGLTLSLLLAMKDANIPQPAAVGLLSPLSDLSFSGPSRSSNRWLDPMLPTRRKMKAFELYTGKADPMNPLLSPVYGDFTACAPMFAQVGSTEILLDDTLRIATKARKCGVDFEMEIWEGMPHVWHLWSILPETNLALKRIGAFLANKLDRYS